MSDIADAREAQRLYKLLQPYFFSLRNGDGYGTGTYTPTYFGAATAGTTTYTTQVGSWTRIGNCIIFTAQVAWTAATGTGVALISLPFTAANVANQWFAASAYHTSVTFGGSGIECLILPNTNYVQLYSPVTNALRLDVTIEAAGQIVLTGMFFV